MKKNWLPYLAALLVFNSAKAQNELYNNGSVLQINTGCIVQVNGDLTNLSGSSLVNNGTLTVTGNITNTQAMMAANAGLLEFSGSVAQTLSGGVDYFANNVLINNAAGVLLNSKLNAAGVVSFTNGIVTTASTSTPFTFGSTGSHTGTSNASHVNGFVIKEGTGSFTYPVGDGSRYQMVDANLSVNATGMMVRYFATNAGAGSFTNGGSEATPLASYNTNEYWDFTPVSTATGTVTIYWDGYRDVFSNTLSQRKVAHRTGGNWLNEGGAGTGTTTMGTVTSNSISNWSPLALGSISVILPLSWLSVNGTLNANKQAVITYKVNETNVAKYQIEKSTDSRNYNNIATLVSKGNGENNYQYTEPISFDGIAFYRIKQIDTDGKFGYSPIVKLTNKQTSFVSIYPNPVKNITTISNATIGGNAILTDANGKALQQFIITQPNFLLDMSKYQAGVYMLKLGNAVVQKIIKE